MLINKLIEVWKDGDLSWKLPKKFYLMRTYGQNIFFIKNKQDLEIMKRLGQKS